MYTITKLCSSSAIFRCNTIERKLRIYDFWYLYSIRSNQFGEKKKGESGETNQNEEKNNRKIIIESRTTDKRKYYHLMYMVCSGGRYVDTFISFGFIFILVICQSKSPIKYWTTAILMVHCFWCRQLQHKNIKYPSEYWNNNTIYCAIKHDK